MEPQQVGTLPGQSGSRRGAGGCGTCGCRAGGRPEHDSTLDGVADQITAPTPIMGGENDQFLKGEPQKVHKALTNADAPWSCWPAPRAPEHTHAGALGRAHQVISGWLDTTLAA